MKKLLMGLMAALVIVTSNGIAVSAKTIQKDKLPKEAIVQSYENGDKIIVPSKKITDKESYVKSIDDAVVSGEVTALGGTYPISDEDSLSYSDGTVYSKFNSTIYWDYIKSSTVSGTSRSCWTGRTPFYCSNISLTDSINFGGPVVSISLGSGAGSGWSASFQTAAWTKSYSNQWAIDHTFSNISCIGYDIYIKEISTGDFEFGTSNYTTTASDSQWL